MPYISDMNSTELRAHMKRITDMGGWDEPVADRLWREIEKLDAEIARLRSSGLEQAARGKELWEVMRMTVAEDEVMEAACIDAVRGAYNAGRASVEAEISAALDPTKPL